MIEYSETEKQMELLSTLRKSVQGLWKTWSFIPPTELWVLITPRASCTTWTKMWLRGLQPDHVWAASF